MFTGGRGTGTITEALLKHGQISLTLLVNAYDDGLSTGALRTFIPGMLGPSDIRKNVSRLIEATDRSDRAVKRLLEYRLPDALGPKQAVEALECLGNVKSSNLLPEINVVRNDLNFRQLSRLAVYLKAFLTYWRDQQQYGVDFEFGDCSLGNILFAGAYLSAGKSFNGAIDEFSGLAHLRGKVLNVTNGENLVLMAMKENGALLRSEAEIVAEQDAVPIQEIYLLSESLNDVQYSHYLTLNLDARHAYMRQLSKTPLMNSVARDALESANIIVYGPGTQHSSLFPSYLTGSLGQLISNNRSAEKIFIGNIYKDHEIRNETTSTLIQKFFYYLAEKGKTPLEWSQLVTLFFLQQPPSPSQADSEYVTFDQKTFPFPRERVVLTNWETGGGAHSGGRVLDELIGVVNSKLQKTLKPYHHTVSVVVPGLNEEKTVKQVLHQLSLLNLEFLGLGKEIIYVDGGSSDTSLELARSERDVRVFQLDENQRGRGAALRLGIEKASGNIIAFFPSDNEYFAADLIPVVQAIVQNEFQAVFGSRAIKCVNLDKRILDIYQGNRFLYLTSKYGGILVSIVCLLLYNRFISDPFTGIKAFDARLLRGLKLRSTGFEFETELIAKLGKQGTFILELPVDYRPRTRTAGKKTTIWDGLRSLINLFKVRVATL